MKSTVLLTCTQLLAISGDSIQCDRIPMRDLGDGGPFHSSYVAPEIYRARCQKERELGVAAKARMQEFLDTPGVQVFYSGNQGFLEWPLVRVILPNGRSAGSVLMEEGLVQVMPSDEFPDWCNEN
ncbi:thermonuclease family protein [Roseibium salinum]|uniref:Thermonuclease family protein n=1 Tax=Roseibium salinum TaxID=1604349 RepID=A0ABT3QYI3_9HYPH|nr:thermonuclease family protein [Roseibium sp. DSM 29163]MCX2721960.1 thermonuclease family protein [Roseibium sp. DSM 29163]